MNPSGQYFLDQKVTRDPTTGIILSQQTNISDQTITFTYDTNLNLLNAGRPTLVRTTGIYSAPNRVTTYTSQGLPLQDYLDDGAGHTRGQSYTYDPVENYYLASAHTFATGITDTTGRTTNYTTGSNGLPASSSTTFTSPNGGNTSFNQSWTYNQAGKVLTETSGQGVITMTTYDSLGRVHTKNTPGKPIITITYPNNLQANWSSTNGTSGSTIKDGFGRQISKLRGDAVTETYLYDIMGRKTSLFETNNAGVTRTSNWTYDPLGRVVTQSSYASSLTQNVTYAQGGKGTIITSTLSNGVISTVTTNEFGDTLDTQNPIAENYYTFDGLHHPLQVYTWTAGTGANQQERTFTYSGLGDLLSSTAPETGTTSINSLDALGNPTSVSFAGVRTITQTYDGLGRLRARSNTAAGDAVSFVYNGMALGTASNQSSQGTTVISYGYDANGSLNNETVTPDWVNASPWSIGYVNDSNGNLSQLTYPDGQIVNYIYDYSAVGFGRPVQVTTGINGASVAKIGYDNWGNRNLQTYGSLAQDLWTYDPASGTKLLSWNATPAGGQATSRGYSYDPMNHLTSAGEWTSLTHDVLGRLTQATGFGLSDALTYDEFDNNISAQAPGNAPPSFNNFTFNPLTATSQIPPSTPGGVQTGWLVNPGGDATNVGAGIGSLAPVLGLGWDGLGRLSSVTNSASGGTETYTYSPLGMRIAKANSLDPIQNRYYAYTSGGKLLTEWSQTNATQDIGQAVSATGVVYGPTTSTHMGLQAARIWHQTGNNSEIDHFLGTFPTGDTLTATIWVNAPAGTLTQVFIGNAGGSAPTYTDCAANGVMGTGTWQLLTVTLPSLSRSVPLWLYLYCNCNTSAPTGTFTVIDDISMLSALAPSQNIEWFSGGPQAPPGLTAVPPEVHGVGRTV